MNLRSEFAVKIHVLSHYREARRVCIEKDQKNRLKGDGNFCLRFSTESTWGFTPLFILTMQVNCNKIFLYDEKFTYSNSVDWRGGWFGELVDFK
jgi:hypothetical protein